MTLTIESTAVKLRAAFQTGLQWRKAGKTIQTKEQFIEARTVLEPGTISAVEEHRFLEDLYYSYSAGYRSFVPSPREVKVNNGW